MKYRTTKKAVMNGYARVYCARFAEFQHLLRKADAVAYVADETGWRADIYDLGIITGEMLDVAICTGYGPFGREMPDGLAKEYDRKAAALDVSAMGYDAWSDALRVLQREFLRKLVDDDNK